MTTVAVMGKYFRRPRRADKKLQELTLAEAHRLYESGVPLSTAVDRMMELAGDNPNAFGLGRVEYRKFIEAPEGEAITRLMMLAETKRMGLQIDFPVATWWPGGS